MLLQVSQGVSRMHDPDSCLPGPFLRVGFAASTLRDEEMAPFGQRVCCLHTACCNVSGAQAQCPTLVMQLSMCRAHLEPLLCPHGPRKPTQLLMLVWLVVIQESRGFCQHFGNCYRLTY